MTDNYLGRRNAHKPTQRKYLVISVAKNIITANDHFNVSMTLRNGFVRHIRNDISISIENY